MRSRKLPGLILVLFLIIFASLSGLYLKQQTELRKGAYFAEASLSLNLDKSVVDKGEKFDLSIFIDSKDKKISGFDLIIEYDPEKLEFLGERVVNVLNMPFTDTIKLKNYKEKGRVRVVRVAKSKTEELRIRGQLLSILSFKGKQAGEGKIVVKRIALVGYNPQLDPNQPDVVFKVGGDKEVKVKINPSQQLSGPNKLIIKTKIKGVQKAKPTKLDAQVKIVRNNEIIKAYDNLKAQIDSEGNVLVEVGLGEIEEADDYFVLLKIKGALQKKYCMNWQKDPCSWGGGISLGGNREVVLNLTDYPIEMGDVNNDGRVDVADVSFVKSKYGKSEKIADLDFNGGVNTRDVIILLMTLSEKYDEEF